MTTIEPHLSSCELEHRYETASEPIAKSHFHALWLLSRGYDIDEVADLLSFSTRWVRSLIKRYNEGGPERLGDQRVNNGTEATILTPGALARPLSRTEVGPRSARLGCADGDRLVDPAAASPASRGGRRGGSRGSKKNCSGPSPTRSASILTPRSRSGRRTSIASA